MTTSMLVFGKASVHGSLKGTLKTCVQHQGTAQFYSTNGRFVDRHEDRAAQRELLVDVLGVNATKRDAKQYLARFKAPKKSTRDQFKSSLQENLNAGHRQAQERLDRSGINLGGLYAPARAIAETPQFTQHQQHDKKADPASEMPMHIALVCLRAPETIHDATLDGLAATLTQLVRLGMQIVLVLDCQPGPGINTESGVVPARNLRNAFFAQCDRLRKAVGQFSPQGARSVIGAMEVIEDNNQQVKVAVPNLIIDPLKRGIVTIIPSLAYTQTGKLVTVETDEVMVSLLRELSGIENATDGTDRVASSVERIIILDQLGGIPSKARGHGAHVFVNLEQEYDQIREELAEYSTSSRSPPQHEKVYSQHLSNLNMTQRCLALLPPASSALVISPQEAASASSNSREPIVGAAGTRPQKNTLIHNLLTNKPVVSSSLPVARIASSTNEFNDVNDIVSPAAAAAATLIRRGMPLTIIPSANRERGWLAPLDGKTSMRLEDDVRIDFARLLRLIEESFGRKLDVKKYLSRIEGRIAGLIVAGEYEGGAILTWEMPPGTNHPARLVPYLDKFAVLPTSQGSSGVADIVFQAMLRTCFPNGVCWRSRKSNPANKWYFERAVGTWQIPDSNWTMFWTGDGIVQGEQRWNDYVGVCQSIVHSWADTKVPD